jgi:hypothetical protein
MTGSVRPDQTIAANPDNTEALPPDKAADHVPDNRPDPTSEPTTTPEPEASQPQVPEPAPDAAVRPLPAQGDSAAEPAVEEGAPATAGDEAGPGGQADEGKAAESTTEAEPVESADRAAHEKPTPEAKAAEGTPEAKAAEGAPEAKKRKKKPKPKPEGPSVAEVVARIGATSEQALAYVASPDPKLSRLPRKVREALIAELPGVTGAALLGPAALARHLVGSAATGRYRDLFVLWDLFRRFPEQCKPMLAERQQALERARGKLRVAVRIGLRGRAERVAEDIRRAEGLIWQWLRETLLEVLPAVGARPAIAAALLEREPDLDVPIPAQPRGRWLAEAAAARGADPLPGRLEEALAKNAHRLPATVETLRLATRHYPDRVPALLDRVDLEAPDVGAFLAWARDHDAADRLYARVRDGVSATAARDRAKGLALWHRWTERGVEVPLPGALQTDSLEGFDLSRPETAAFAARLLERGVELNLQAELEAMAGRNRQLAEKAYEAMVCAGLDVSLPAALHDNPIVKEGTRCPKCQAWTWVRPGHEERCPRPAPPPKEPEPDPFELAAAEATRAEGS